MRSPDGKRQERFLSHHPPARSWFFDLQTANCKLRTPSGQLKSIVRSKLIRYINPEQVRATRPSGSAHLRVEFVGDQTILSARIKRAFPSSKPGQFLSIQTGDNKEVAILKTVEGLDKETRQLIETELDRRYFTPKINRINMLRQEAGMWRFVVETQRGEAEFYVRNWRDNAFEISTARWLIHSVDGGRFEIMDLEALDGPSRALMDQLL